MLQLSINLIEANNYADERLDKLNQVIKILGDVLNSTLFEDSVKSYTVGNQRSFFYRKNFLGTAFIDSRRSNEEVYDIIMNGTENPGNSAPHSMDLYLTLRNGSDGSVIGYGDPGGKTIFTYSTMFDNMDLAELANHYTHEWCHKLGFTHSHQRNRNRKYSVPYAVGDIVEEIAETLIGQHNVLTEGSGNEVFSELDHSDPDSDTQDTPALNDLVFQAPKTGEWRTAECLKALLKQINTLAPNRKKASDGTIGDIHHLTTSDHSPWVVDQATKKGVVTALDVTHSPGNCDCNALAQSFQLNKDSRIKYVIWNKRIMNSSSIGGAAPWTWRNYKGKNPHDHHIHISVLPEKSKYDSTAHWNINVKPTLA